MYTNNKHRVYLCGSSKAFAAKFVHKENARNISGYSVKDIKREGLLQKYCSNHRNILSCSRSGEDDKWVWFVLDVAGGGDLFSKIEADVGVHEDVAHMYFKQLIGAVQFLHSRGVAHRDIKPENILLDAQGNLLLSDFGLATIFKRHGRTKQSSTVCGSPPYVAPEILANRGPYDLEPVDIWSCGIILFVLLTGCTPWNWAVDGDRDFCKFVSSAKKLNLLQKIHPWKNIAREPLSLIIKILEEDPKMRFSFSGIRTHPWFMRKNPLLHSEGICTDSMKLAETMLGGMHIDLRQNRVSSSTDPLKPRSLNNMNVYSCSQPTELAARQSDLNDVLSQPVLGNKRERPNLTQHENLGIEEISLLQYSKKSDLPNTLDTITQKARKFEDLLPKDTLNRFYVQVSLDVLKSYLQAFLLRKGIRSILGSAQRQDCFVFAASLRDRRQCPLNGRVKCYVWPGYDGQFIEVIFERIKGDPLEWRRVFKEAALDCAEIIYTGEFE